MTCGRSGAPQAVPGERHTLGSFLERMVRLLQHPQEAAPFLDPPRGAPLLLPPSTVHQAPSAPLASARSGIALSSRPLPPPPQHTLLNCQSVLMFLTEHSLWKCYWRLIIQNLFDLVLVIQESSGHWVCGYGQG